MKLLKNLNLFILLTTLAILTACNDAPTDVGASFLGDTIAVLTLNTQDTTILTAVNCRLKRSNLFNSGILMIGRTNQSSSTDLHTAVTFLRFKNIPGNMNTINNQTITGCKLLMYATHAAFGDTNSALSFTVNSIYNDHPWADSAAVFTWDKIFTDDNGTTSCYNTSPLGSFSGVIPYVINDDTSTYAIEIPLATSFIAPWIQIVINRDSLKNADSTNWGLALMPTDKNNVIRYFSTLSSSNTTRKQPIIRVYYMNNGVADSLDMPSTFDASWVSGTPPDPKSITVVGGVQYFTDLSFDLSKILPNVAGINLAELELTLDRSKCQVGNIPLNSSLYATLRSNDAADTILYTYVADTATKTNPDTYKFASIRTALEKWNSQAGTEQNKGKLTLQTLTSGLLNKYVFYGPDAADTTKRPKLRLIYAKRPVTGNGK